MTARSTVGMVWKANARVQKLPVTNKAACKRLALEVNHCGTLLTVVNNPF